MLNYLKIKTFLIALCIILFSGVYVESSNEQIKEREEVMTTFREVADFVYNEAEFNYTVENFTLNSKISDRVYSIFREKGYEKLQVRLELRQKPNGQKYVIIYVVVISKIVEGGYYRADFVIPENGVGDYKEKQIEPKQKPKPKEKEYSI